MEPRVVIVRLLPGPDYPGTERVIVVDAPVKDYLRVNRILNDLQENG